MTIETLEITWDSNCEIKFEADIEDCNNNRDEFLRLAYYNKDTNCFSFNGVSNNNGNMGRPIATHLTPYYYVDYIPDDFD